ncbi:UDP-glycosyltransferase 708G1 [Quercus suber]|uniref:UDP-glycosyltransferase 708G1 n=1 Tax=Quercus suber TaxID=58331 RepID=UPI000CE28E5D|nr:UDP-glycosyltransferase 13-like [Quercus suber]POE50812.1 udp-glycosyltransferase 13 [Quercus suber]
MSACDDLLHPHPHVALLPSAGMGHLTPFLRLATQLVHHHCNVTLITTHPIVSLSESKLITHFLTAFPQVNQVKFNLLPLDHTTANSTDPFFLHFETIRRSAHLLSPLLASLSLPLHALVCDVTLISSVIPVTEGLHLPNYILFTSSAKMLSFFSYFHIYASKAGDDDPAMLGDVEIPGLPSIPRSSIPPLLLIPNNIFANIFKVDSPKVTKSNGVLINTFEGLEAVSLELLNGGKVVEGMPPVFAVGPLVPCDFEKGELGNNQLKWLNEQPVGSVVYVSFGSRTAMSRDQIREIGYGLIRSGCKFLWVVKDKKVDKEEEEGLEEVVGHELMESLKAKGLVVKNWVDQGEILGHKAVGGFVSHCGWNSVIEAAWHGVPILAWPQHGDQKINAEVVERSGFGMWVTSWGWGEKDMVKGDEFGERIREMMGSELLRGQATNIREEARKALGDCGSCEMTFKRLVAEWKMKGGCVSGSK